MIYLRYIILTICFLTNLSSQIWATEFAPIVEGRAWDFPRDHGAHPEFKTEWWYFTGHVQDSSGRIFGFQWTVFRNALRPSGDTVTGESAWRTNQVYLGHLAISDLRGEKFEFSESSARSALNLAGASEKGFRVWLPGFLADSTEDGWTIHGEGKDIRLDLQMPTPEAPLLHGRDGFSPKADETGKASYYYSLPLLPIQGTLRIGTQKYAVQGQAWMDHEFGSGQLGSKQRGWDWMGLPLGNKATLMVYRLRDSQDSQQDFISGTYVDTEGKAHSLSRKDIQLIPSQKWESPRSGGEYPLEWRVRIPAFAVDLEVKANFPDQELDTRASTQVIYWEGSVTAQGRLGDLEIKSLGYLEMTGYARAFDRDI